MLKWALIFLIIAVVAGIFGFTNVEAASATIAQWLFGIFVVLFLGALIIGLTLGAKLPGFPATSRSFPDMIATSFSPGCTYA
jgi:uncharacterized membrane protein YtjA (UPF0391 family)